MVDLHLLKVLSEALAVGLLIGVERYKAREPGEQRPAGLRTFAFISLLGAVCGIFPQIAVALVTFSALATLLLIGYSRTSRQSPGATTEVAAMLAFWLGFLLHSQETLAIGFSVVMVILLALKRVLHKFVKERISETEFFDTLKFLAVVLVVFPLLPNRAFGPFDFFNPAEIWLLVVLVSTIGYSGYFFMRLLGPSKGLRVSALLGGIVSTPAVTMSLAQHSRNAKSADRLLGVVAVMANAVQFPRLLLLIAIISWQLAVGLVIPFACMFLVGIGGAMAMGKGEGISGKKPSVQLLIHNPYAFFPALKFGIFYAAVFLVSKAASNWLGEAGIYLAGAVAGLASTSAIALSAAKLVDSGGLTPHSGVIAVWIAVSVNAFSKWVLALLNGNREMALWLGAGLFSMLVAGAVAILLAGA